MDQTLINWLMASVGAAFGFFGKSIWESVKELQRADKALAEKVNSIEVLVAGKYVTRDELGQAIGRIVDQLDRIEGKLEKKADR